MKVTSCECFEKDIADGYRFRKSTFKEDSFTLSRYYISTDFNGKETMCYDEKYENIKFCPFCGELIEIQNT